MATVLQEVGQSRPRDSVPRAAGQQPYYLLARIVAAPAQPEPCDPCPRSDRDISAGQDLQVTQGTGTAGECRPFSPDESCIRSQPGQPMAFAHMVRVPGARNSVMPVETLREALR